MWGCVSEYEMPHTPPPLPGGLGGEDSGSNSNVPFCCLANRLSPRIGSQLDLRDLPNIETYQGSSVGLGKP